MKHILVIVVFCITSSLSFGETYQQSEIYKKAIKKYNKSCTDFEVDLIEIFRKRAKSQAEQGWTKAAMLKDARKFLKEKGYSSSLNSCLVAIIYVERGPGEYLAQQKQIKQEIKARKELINSLTNEEIAWIVYREKNGIKYLLRKKPRVSSTRAGWGRQINPHTTVINPPPSRIDSLPKVFPKVGVFGKIIEEIIIVQIIDKNSALVQYGDRYMWLKTNTESYVDGVIFRTDEIYQITGTHKYQTTAGLNTVLVIKPVKIDHNKLDRLDDIAIQEIVAKK